MTESLDADRKITAFLSEGPVELADRSYEAVRHSIERTRQHRVFGPWSLPGLSDSARVALVVGAILIALVAGFDFVSGLAESERPPVASPSQSPSQSPAQFPSPRTLLLPNSWGTDLQPGTYRLGSGFPVPLTFDLPSGWSACSLGIVELGVCAPPAAALQNAGVSFLIVEDVVADPCVNQGLDPPVGGTVDDLAAAIAGLPGFAATTPADVTVDGHVGKEITVTAPAESACDSLYTWATANRTNGVGPGEVNRLNIVDVDGARVLIAADWFPTGQSPVEPPELRRVFESVRFPRD
jgi:hypothetical protein